MTADLINGAAFGGALLLACIAAWSVGRDGEERQATVLAADAPPPGATQVVDARGFAVPVAPYQRIVSLNTVADHALLRLVEPERLVAITFMESQICDEKQRDLLYTLNEVAALEGLKMDWENRVRLEHVRHSLHRMWST